MSFIPPANYFRFFILSAFLCCLLPDLGAQTDTLYVKKYDRNIVPRILTNLKSQKTSFVSRTDSTYSADHFSTGGQYFVGAEISYKWSSLGYSIGFNKANSSANTDLRFSTSIKPIRLQLNYTSLRNLSYFRVNGLQQEDTAFIVRQHNIALRNAGIKVDYVFNYKKFYYSSSISQVGRQLKSQGSFILSSGAYYQDFDLKGLSDSTGSLFFDRYSADRFKTMQAELGLGYAYNWVLNKRLVIYVSEIPNLGFQQIRASQHSAADQHYSLSFTNYVRAGITYTRGNLFAGAYVYNSVTTSKWSGYFYNNAYTSVQFHVGWVLGDLKDYLRR
ncbi:MAG: hypothetical protein K0S33_4308 [Bacteroidetes bacterium]|nr:hypothetical protein [Bacteroidota bacterium]